MDGCDAEQEQDTTPGGSGIEHVVRQGDCAASPAAEYGHFWQTIRNHPSNAELKRRRTDPNVLYPGEVILLPDKVLREEVLRLHQPVGFGRHHPPADRSLLYAAQPPCTVWTPGPHPARGLPEALRPEPPARH
ncbi:MAG: hypothetical protein FJW35_08240 [Acidobacteria bacterium]|nr:hypothetical protein [Acidobacteriota bacterium]